MPHAAPPYAQRWHHGREMKRPPGERINPREYGVEVIGDRLAKPFVCRHHYAGSYPAAHVAFGLFRKTGVHPARLVGVAVFSEGVRSAAAMPKWTGFPRDRGTELGRLVLLDEVLHNGETYMGGKAFDALRAMRVMDPATGRERPRFRAVLSYSDPVARRSALGQIIKNGHVGCIYQGLGAIHPGFGAARTLHLAPDGRVVHPYAFDKVAKGRRNAAAAERAILAAGCPPRLPGEVPDAWVARAKAALRPFRHPGNIAYVWGLDRDAWTRIRALHGDGLPYPKIGREPFRSMAA